MLKLNGVTDEDKSIILKFHNSLRSCIAIGKEYEECKGTNLNQPSGKNIQELVWDNALAVTAQKWANECTFAHDTPKNRFDARFCVGQNVHVTKFTHDFNATADFPHAVRRWFNEHADYNYSKHVKVTKKKTGHYTQLIWATSNLVGCGYTYYRDTHDEYYKYKKLYVCNYGPCGNEVESFPYDHGIPACDQYNLTWSAYSGLCVNSQFLPIDVSGSHPEAVVETQGLSDKIQQQPVVSYQPTLSQSSTTAKYNQQPSQPVVSDLSKQLLPVNLLPPPANQVLTDYLIPPTTFQPYGELMDLYETSHTKTEEPVSFTGDDFAGQATTS